MAVKLRFKRTGMPKQPHYRLVAIDHRSARNGKELEILGHYDPRAKENAFIVKSDRVQYWLSCGAQPSDTVRSLLARNGLSQSSSTASPAPAKAAAGESGNK